MADFVYIELTQESVKKTLATLDSLTPRLQNKLLKPALQAGADMIRNAMVAAAPMSGVKWPTKQPKNKRPGTLKAAMRITLMKRKRGRIGMNIGAWTGSMKDAAGEWQQGAFYAAFVEFGHGIGKASLGLRRGMYHLRKGNISVLGDILKTFKRGRKRGKFTLEDSRARVEGLHFMERTGQAKAAAAVGTITRHLQANLAKIMHGPPPPPGDA